MRFLPCLLVFISPYLVHAQQPKPPDPAPPSPNIPVKVIPDKITSDAGRLISITLAVDPKSGEVEWDVPDGFDVAKSPDGKSVYAVALPDTKAADYKFKVYVPLDNKIVKGTCVVTIKGPPLPKPPETGLLVDLRAAYAQDGNDPTNLKNLIQLFDIIQSYCDDKSIKDVGTLMDTVKGASDSIFKNSPNALTKCRARISQELITQITENDSTTLTDTLRTKIKSVFSNISNVLKQLQTPPTLEKK